MAQFPVQVHDEDSKIRIKTSDWLYWGNNNTKWNKKESDMSWKLKEQYDYWCYDIVVVWNNLLKPG